MEDLVNTRATAPDEHCPRCGSSDRVRRASEHVAGHLDWIKHRLAMTGDAGIDEYKRELRTLLPEMSPPRSMGRRMRTIVWDAFTSASLAVLVFMNLRSEGGDDPTKVILNVAILIACAIRTTMSLRPLISGEVRRRYERERSAFGQTQARWEALRYCRSCDVVFLPGTGISGPLDEARSLVTVPADLP
jgi:hypothetical protein